MLANENGQVYGINKRFLDPRRPESLNAHDKEEGLIPYKSHLDFNPKDVLSHDHQVGLG